MKVWDFHLVPGVVTEGVSFLTCTRGWTEGMGFLAWTRDCNERRSLLACTRGCE